METIEQIKDRLRKLRDKPGVDLVEEFAPMLYAERQEHARTSSVLAQCQTTLGRLNEQVVEQSRAINQQSKTINEQNTNISKLEAELATLRAKNST